MNFEFQTLADVESLREGWDRTLQRMFLLLGVGETAGSGFSRILRAWQEQHWVAPTLEEDVEHDVTVLRMGMASLLPTEVLESLERHFAGRFSGLDENRRMAVAIARIEGRVTNRRLRTACTLHPRDLTFLLGDLVREGFLEPHGERGGTWYTIPGDPAPDAASSQEPPNRSQVAPSYTQKSPQDGLSYTQPASDYAQSLPPHQERWRSTQATQAAILSYCATDFRTPAEIAKWLGRDVVTVKKNYLRPLVVTGRLMPLHPDRPTHPHQAYRATSE